jgi:hypothetical protein
MENRWRKEGKNAQVAFRKKLINAQPGYEKTISAITIQVFFPPSSGPPKKPSRAGFGHLSRECAGTGFPAYPRFARAGAGRIYPGTK